MAFLGAGTMTGPACQLGLVLRIPSGSALALRMKRPPAPREPIGRRRAPPARPWMRLWRRAPRRAPHRPASRCSWERGRTARPPARQPARRGLAAGGRPSAATRTRRRRRLAAHMGRDTPIDFLLPRGEKTCRICRCAQSSCDPSLRGEPGLRSLRREIRPRQARSAIGTTRALLMNQGKMIAEKDGRDQGFVAPMTVRSTRLSSYQSNVGASHIHEPALLC